MEADDARDVFDVDLLSSDGKEHVATVQVHVFTTAPDVISWGVRMFQRHAEDESFRECFHVAAAVRS